MSSFDASTIDDSASKQSTTVDVIQILDALQEPLLVLGEDLEICQVNPAFYHTFSTTPKETIGTSLYDLKGGLFDLPLLRRHLHGLVNEGTPVEGLELDREFEEIGRRVLTVKGRKLGAKEESAKEEVPYFLISINDVTRQHRLEEKLSRHRKELERSNADLEQFAYAASHDLQEPLRMVSSYLQLLERRYKEDLDETAQEFIDYAVSGAGRMKSLINGLLQYSRVGRKEKEFEEVDLSEVIDDIRDDLRRRIEEKGGTVTRDSLPSTYGNRSQLRRVFQNLIENALTYHGDRPPNVHITGEAVAGEDGEGNGAHVTVCDEGPGISPEAQEKVFQIFKQLDPHGEGKEGSGMGLAICKKIVERHEGEMWVESEPGEGASFHVTFHLSPADVS